ncbi:MAG: SDR family NAD(P)-dependent oxidoreductase [Candidatus Eremiobacteraeota bacterium]|nr:SDR family NAD(P)-dependent oxidoreductase [Candidatus Eremiobacteraeota bacterium]MBC5803704.1 SDR family NAD(P)-dependent oxidoreductase [Candidatus Eremiobacteraeota bacterium]MBC5823073.1 SDR family NAD(P)-dependent oxidoreductase [Candidatus Eremiobacteraeota bacterium]
MKARRVAIITGASSGIGRALTERAVRAGWDVFAVGRRAERLAELEERLKGATGRLATVAFDLRSAGAAPRIVRATLERFGRIDVLVNNAGGVAVGSIAQQSDDALREQMETHVIVPLALTREALPALRESHGHVFYVGSGVARIPVGALGAYPPAKAAVRNMTRIVRNELRSDGIAVTYVDPGAVATEFMTRAGFAGPPPSLAASPYTVARKIFNAFETRRRVVNAVPWQTAVVAFAEALPALTDFIVSRAPQIVVGKTAPVLADGATAGPAAASPPPTPLPAAAQLAEPAVASPSPSGAVALESAFDAALEAPSGRMRKLNLRKAFVRELLVPDNELDLGDVALRWAGMPNKNERALTHEVLEALASAGFLARIDEERYRVLRADDGA